MTDEQERQLQQARGVGRREPLWGDMTDLHGDPTPEASGTDKLFLTSTPESWLKGRSARSEFIPSGPGSPDERITVIEESSRCLWRGLGGLIPIAGLPFAVLALGSYARVRRAPGVWNPAERQLLAGVGLAVLGLVITAVIESTLLPLMLQLDWPEVALVVFAPLVFCFSSVRLLVAECCEAAKRHTLWALILMLTCVLLLSGVGLAGLIGVPLLVYAALGSFTTRLDASVRRNPGGHLLVAAGMCLAQTIQIVPHLPPGWWVMPAVIFLVAPVGGYGLRAFHTAGFGRSRSESLWLWLLWLGLLLPALAHFCYLANEG